MPLPRKLLLAFAIILGTLCLMPRQTSASSCGKDEFRCSDGERCIQAESKCDGWNDCTDGSDETTVVCGVNCEKLEGGGFACADRQCIKAEHKCNGKGGTGNCADGSDETPQTCGAGCEEVEGGGFACADGKQCIKKSYKCDGGDPD